MIFEYGNSFDIKEKIQQAPTAILPIGAVEAHGPHLPLGTDNFLAVEMAKKLSSEINSFILPTLPYGQVWSLRNFPGSITVSNQSMINMIVDIGVSLWQQGFTTFIMMNGHLGNQNALKDVARILYEKVPDLKTYYFFYPGMNIYADEVRENQSAHAVYFHACEIETSYMLYLAPEHVQMDRAITDIPNIPIDADVTPTPWETFTKSAVLGDATSATQEKGEYILTRVIQNMVKILRQEGKS
jgi:creatinine amidohydrolase